MSNEKECVEKYMRNFFEENSVTSVMKAFCTIQVESEKDVSLDVIEIIKEKAVLEVTSLDTQETFETRPNDVKETAIAMKIDWENGMTFEELKKKYSE